MQLIKVHFTVNAKSAIICSFKKNNFQQNGKKIWIFKQKNKKKENLVKNWQTLKKYDNESVKHIKKKYRANGASNVAYEKAKYQDCSMKYEHIFFLLFHQNITYLVGFHDVSIALEQPSKVSRKYSWLFKASFILSITSKSCKIRQMVSSETKIALWKSSNCYPNNDKICNRLSFPDNVSWNFRLFTYEKYHVLTAELYHPVKLFNNKLCICKTRHKHVHEDKVSC